MNSFNCILWLSFLSLLSFVYTNTTYNYEIRKFEVPLDHFSYNNNHTFQIRYLINDSFVTDKENSIFLFFIGGESNVVKFAEISGFVWEIASHLNAVVIFAEHRYYGESLPFGTESFEGLNRIGYLTVSQALADFAALIDHVNPKENRRPVIAFGGSYGGILAVWIRMKYTHLITGSIASSAPIRHFDDTFPCYKYYQTVTSIFHKESPQCVQNIRNMYPLISEYLATYKGRDELAAKFNFCDGNIYHLKDYIQNVYEHLAISNYPYDSNLFVPLPAYPVREFCKRISNPIMTGDSKTLLDLFAESIQIYANYTRNVNCLMNHNDKDLHKKKAWTFQCETEIFQHICSNGETDMFLSSEWSYDDFVSNANAIYGLKLSKNEIINRFGVSNLREISNIVFSNGLLDPWSVYGVLESPSKSTNVEIVIIPEGAHHIDLQASHVDDPRSVKDARRIHLKSIRNWVNQWKKV